MAELELITIFIILVGGGVVGSIIMYLIMSNKHLKEQNKELNEKAEKKK